MSYKYMELTKATAKVGKRYNIDGQYMYIANEDSVCFFDDAPVCQECFCGGCGAHITSWSKDAICPKCGKSCYLT